MKGKIILFTASSALGGILFGGVLALLGSFLPEDLRAGVTLAVVVLLVIVGLIEARGGRVRMFQLDVETSQRWLDLGAVGWAVANGVALGMGAISRIGFPIWYLLPVTAFASGMPLLGMGIGVAYGLTRGLVTIPWFWYMNAKIVGSNEVAELLFELKPVGHRIGGVMLALLSVFTALAVA